MSLVLHGFTAENGWTQSRVNVYAVPGRIYLAPTFNELGEAKLIMGQETDGFPQYTTYTYHDMQNDMWKGTDLERRQKLYNLVMEAVKNLIGDWKVRVELFDPGYSECEGIVLSSLQYECFRYEHDCLFDISKFTLRLPTRSLLLHTRHEHTIKILDNIKWSADFEGIIFADYDSTEHVIPPLVLKRYKELRNMQYIFEFTPFLGLDKDNQEWIKEVTKTSHDTQEVKKLFSDIPICNSLKFVITLPCGTRYTEDVYTRSGWMTDILIQAGKPEKTGEKSQLSDLPVELLKKIYFA
jgi:hypothetical protein